MIKSLYIDDYELHAEGRTDRWLSPKVEGLDAPTYRETTYERPGEDGGIIANQLYGMRLVRLPGHLTASDPASFATARRQLQAVCAIQRDSTGRPILKTIRVVTLDDLEFTIQGVTKSPSFGSEGLDHCDFQIQIKCPRPQLLGAGLSSGQVTIASSIGVAFPWVFDPTIEFGASTGGVAELNNIGTMTGWLTVTLSGVLTNPTLYHEESGQYMALNYTTIEGDEVVIDMAEHTIIRNGSQSLMSARTIGSDWFGLAVGQNTFRFTTGSTSDTGTVEVTAYASYLGV